MTKRLASIVVYCCTVVALHAQKTPYDTIPFALEHHQQRLALFSQEHLVKGKTIFLGNSIMEFGDWKKILNDSTVVNRGIAGDNTYGVLARLNEVVASQPSRVFLEIGINDIGRDIPEDVIAGNIYSIVHRITSGSRETRVFVHSILPTNGAAAKRYPEVANKNGHAMTLNALLERNAKRTGFTFVDLYRELVDKDGNLSVAYAKSDGLHLNAAGYQLWVEILKKNKYL